MTTTSERSFSTRLLRRLVQTAVLASALGLGFAYAGGYLAGSVERLCPMGGIATLWSVFSDARFTCATGELNLVALAAVIAMALVFRKSFCGWICPVGFVHEGLARMGRRLGIARSISLSRDGVFRSARLVVLAAVVALTVYTSELIFRPFCPYYVMSSFHGHEVAWWSYGVLLAIVVGALSVPMFFCRYLCPLGGALCLLSRASATRIVRSEPECTGCGNCDRACPLGLAPSTSASVVSGDCTECLACVESCPESDTLTLGLGTSRAKVSRWLVPGGMAVIVLAAFFLSPLFVFPSYTRTYNEPGAGNPVRSLDLTVDGVICVDTAEGMSRQLDDHGGLVDLTAYAGQRRVVITYDPTVTDPAAIKKAIEAPVWVPQQERFLFNIYNVVERNDVP